MNRIDNIVECDGALILGGGIAGLFTALKLAPMPVTVLSGARAGSAGSSAWAQGGIAAALGPDDDWRAHAADTIAAGAGLCDPAIVELVAQDAPARIADLLDYGAPFDHNPDGSIALGREAAHSKARIVHVKGDRAGAEISATLAARAAATPSIRLLEGFHAVELAVANSRVIGLFARTGSGAGTRLVLLRARAVILATGGLGALYAVTTNPLESRGEGLGMAARAGALIADPEFVQFHPTAIDIGRDPAPLATEALRGEGATLHRRPCHPSPDRGRPQSLPGLPPGHRRRVRAALPHRLRGLPGRRHRSGGAADPGGARRALSHGRYPQRRAGPRLAGRLVGSR